jgi:hypothetical protein
MRKPYGYKTKEDIPRILDHMIRTGEFYACPFAPYKLDFGREHQWQVEHKGNGNCALLALIKAFMRTFDFEFYLLLIRDCFEKLT